MTTQTYRRARHSVSALHAHLVLVTKYRRPVFTDEMLTFAENTMRTVCSELDAELVEFNGETDHVHLLVAYPPTIGDLHPGTAPQRPHRPRGATRIHRRAVSAPACADTSGRRPTSPSPAEAHHCPSSSNTSTAKPDHFERRATPSDTRDGLTPD